MDLHRTNKPFIECIMVGWYTLDRYYNKIDETGAYAAAILLHPNKRKTYLRAVWKRSWIKPGLRRAEDLWVRQYECLAPDQGSTMLCHRSNDRESTELTSYEIWQRQRSAKIAESNSLSSEFKRFVEAPAEAIRFHDSFTVLLVARAEPEAHLSAAKPNGFRRSLRTRDECRSGESVQSCETTDFLRS